MIDMTSQLGDYTDTPSSCHLPFPFSLLPSPLSHSSFPISPNLYSKQSGCGRHEVWNRSTPKLAIYTEMQFWLLIFISSVINPSTGILRFDNRSKSATWVHGDYETDRLIARPRSILFELCAFNLSIHGQLVDPSSLAHKKGLPRKPKRLFHQSFNRNLDPKFSSHALSHFFLAMFCVTDHPSHHDVFWKNKTREDNIADV